MGVLITIYPMVILKTDPLNQHLSLNDYCDKGSSQV